MPWYIYVSSPRYVEQFYVLRSGELFEIFDEEVEPRFQFSSREEAEIVAKKARPRGFSARVCQVCQVSE
jgi:hypothetical protein